MNGMSVFLESDSIHHRGFRKELIMITVPVAPLSYLLLVLSLSNQVSVTVTSR